MSLIFLYWKGSYLYLLSCHIIDQLIALKLFCLLIHNHISVPYDSDALADRKYFVQLMADENNRDSLFRQAVDNLVQAFYLFFLSGPS